MGNMGAHGDGSNLTRNDDRKYNMLVCGLEECKEGTPRLVRQCEDMYRVVGLLRDVNGSLSSTSTKDHFRLGKYTEGSKKPRHILVKFVWSDDVFRVLTKSRELKKPTVVKPDLSPLQRKHESILLKERWSLIQSDESHNSIKFRNSKLFLNNKLYGFVDSTNVFQLSTTHPDKVSENSTLPGDEHGSASHVQAQNVVGLGGSD